MAFILKAMKPVSATALILLSAIVVIVIAPSVDLEPTSLRDSNLAEMAFPAVTLAARVLVPLLLSAVEGWTSAPACDFLAPTNLIVLDCALRC